MNNNHHHYDSTTERILIDNNNYEKSTNYINMKQQQQEQQHNHNITVQILCFNLTNYNSTIQFLLCCSGVFILYIIYGYLQELIFTLDGFQSYGWYLTLIQFFYYILFALCERQFNSMSSMSKNAKQLNFVYNKRNIPLRIYLLLALLTLGTMGLSNSSLGYLNYPTQVIFKCCKLVPVLLGSIIIQKKTYKLLDFIAAIAMCCGLTLFILTDSKISPNFHIIGVLMILGALLCDAIIGNLQEKAMRDYSGTTNHEMVLYSYGIGFMYLFIIMLITGQLYNGMKFCSNYLMETYGYGFIFSLSGYLGIQFVLTLVRTCGAPLAATVTTGRKAVTIIISFIFFSKPFTMQYLWSGLIVVFGIYLNVYSKRSNLTFQDIKNRCKLWLNLRNYTKLDKRFLIEV